MATSERDASDAVSLGDDEDFRDVIDATDVALVEFYTEWCGTCQRLKPTLSAIAADTDATVLLVDIEAHLETAIEYGAQRSPTFVLFAEGRPVKQVSGNRTEGELRALIEEYGA
ncbi:MAG: thioredoxin family protein [Haloferacaceae archaeon]